jgi:hypothetical protein
MNSRVCSSSSSSSSFTSMTIATQLSNEYRVRQIRKRGPSAALHCQRSKAVLRYCSAPPRVVQRKRSLQVESGKTRYRITPRPRPLENRHNVGGCILLQSHNPTTTTSQTPRCANKIICASADAGIGDRLQEDTRDSKAFVEFETEDASTLQLSLDLDGQPFDSFNIHRDRATGTRRIKTRSYALNTIT